MVRLVSRSTVSAAIHRSNHTNADRRISDIAADTGFFNHSHFIHVFSRMTGKTPAKYRMSQLGTAE